MMRCVRRFTPEFVKWWNRLATLAGRSWRVDETYDKSRGKWANLYRAIDRAGKTVDFKLSGKRDVAAGKAVLAKAIEGQRMARLNGHTLCFFAWRRLAERPRGETKARATADFIAPQVESKKNDSPVTKQIWPAN